MLLYFLHAPKRSKKICTEVTLVSAFASRINGGEIIVTLEIDP
jgi:hypothetical protein